MTKQILLEFNNSKEDPVINDFVRKVLYEFSYSNLKDLYGPDSECIRKLIINFLYSGKFDTELNESTKKHLKEAIQNYYLEKFEKILKEEESKPSKDEKKIETAFKKIPLIEFDGFYNKIHGNWDEIHRTHESYLKQLKIINYILVYEAPPYNDKDEGLNYFLINNSGLYATSIMECFNNDNVNIREIMIEENIAYFDLIMTNIPLSTELRSDWSTKQDYCINNKQLPVILFELGICHLILIKYNELKEAGKPIDDLKNIFNPNPLFAIGTPLKTSASILEYFSDKLLKVWVKEPLDNINDIKFGELQSSELTVGWIELFTANLSVTNSQTTFKLRSDGKGEIYPLFKSNITGASNYPSGKLMKNAFDKY